ncbi:hypothetical protein CDEF62S_04723 [Castellaniella defragrans]
MTKKIPPARPASPPRKPGPPRNSGRSALSLDPSGWLPEHPGVLRRPSPNHDQRPGDEDPSLLVIHNISLPPGVFTGNAIIDFFQNRLDLSAHPWFENIRDLRVSSHFLIRRDGVIVQFVATPLRAWHAGASTFQGRERCNDFSIGIELEGTNVLPYTDEQYEHLAALTEAIRKRHAIRWVQGHEHIAPGRKTDPGPAFDWARFERDTGLTAPVTATRDAPPGRPADPASPRG